MIWAYLALSGRILMLGYERIIVKQLGTNAESVGATFLFFSIATLFLLPVTFFAPMPGSWVFLKWALLSGLIYSLAFVLYLRSLSLGEASLVGPLYNFNVFFLLILTFIFLGEKASLMKSGGIILLFYGTSLLNRQNNPINSLIALFRDKASQLMILCSLLMAFGRTIDGHAVQDASPLLYSFSIYLIISLFLLFFLLMKRRWISTMNLLKLKPGKAVIAGLVNAYSYIFLLFAFTRLDISIAEPLSMLSMIITVLLAGIIFKEKIRERLLAVLIMIAGAWMLIS